MVMAHFPSHEWFYDRSTMLALAMAIRFMKDHEIDPEYTSSIQAALDGTPKIIDSDIIACLAKRAVENRELVLTYLKEIDELNEGMTIGARHCALLDVANALDGSRTSEVAHAMNTPRTVHLRRSNPPRDLVSGISCPQGRASGRGDWSTEGGTEHSGSVHQDRHPVTGSSAPSLCG